MTIKIFCVVFNFYDGSDTASDILSLLSSTNTPESLDRRYRFPVPPDIPPPTIPTWQSG